MRLSWRCLTADPEFAAIQPQWESLFAANPGHSPFLAWGWMSAWRRHLAGPHKLRVQVLEDEAGNARAIVPLLERRTGRGRCAVLTNFCAYGPECSDHLGILVHPALGGEASAILAASALKLANAATRIELRSLAGSIDTGDLHTAFTVSGRRTRQASEQPCPSLILPHSWDELLQRLSRNFRSQVRRNSRAINDSAALNMRRVPAADSAAFIERLIQLNRDRMRSTGRVSSLENEAFRLFLRDATDYMANTGMAWMDVIESRQEILAASLNFVHGTSVYYYMGGFSERLRRCGPGNALFAQVIQRAIGDRYQRFDFLRGAEAYKYRWGVEDVNNMRVTALPVGALRSGSERVADAFGAVGQRLNHRFNSG